jgi:hypothetical protein
VLTALGVLDMDPFGLLFCFDIEGLSVDGESGEERTLKQVRAGNLGGDVTIRYQFNDVYLSN